MRVLATTITVAAFAILSAGFASAAVSPTVLETCTTTATIGCPGAVRDFIDSSSAGPELDADLVELANTLADRARDPSITMVACVELRNGIRAAVNGMSLPAPRSEMKRLADELCRGDDDTSNDGGSSSPPPVVLVETVAS